MQEKVIKIPFNSKFFLESHKVIWLFSNRKHITPFILFNILSLLVLISGLIFDRHDAFPVGIVLGSSMSFYYLLKWVEFFERRIKYFKRAKKQAMHFEEESMDCTYIISDDGFGYVDKEKSFKLNWSLYKPFTVYKDNILLILKDGRVSVAIGRSELGDAGYYELCNILKDKIS